MDPKHIRAIEAETMERASGPLQSCESEYNARELDGDRLRGYLTASMTPEAARILRTGSSIGVTSPEAAAALVPFYDLQIVPICSGCAARPDAASAIARSLAPLIDAGLVLPALTDLGAIDDSLLSQVLPHPWVDISVLNRFSVMEVATTSADLPCVLCSSSEDCPVLDGLRTYIEPISGGFRAASDAELRILKTLTLGGHGSAELHLHSLSQLGPADRLAYLLAANNIGLFMQLPLVARLLDARAAVSAPQVEWSLSEFVASDGDGTCEVDELIELAKSVDDRLSLAAEFGVAYDPTSRLEDYVRALAPYAGKLSCILGQDWPGEGAAGPDWGLAHDIAREMNDAVARYGRAESTFKSVAATLRGPVVGAVVFAAARLALDPALAATCGVGSSLIPAALDGVKAKLAAPRDAKPLPASAAALIEGAMSLPPGTIALHEMRGRVMGLVRPS